MLGVAGQTRPDAQRRPQGLFLSPLSSLPTARPPSAQPPFPPARHAAPTSEKSLDMAPCQSSMRQA